MSIWINELLSELQKTMRQAETEIRKSPVPLTKGQIKKIQQLQRQAVTLRDTAISHCREQEHSLVEVGAMFEISPSRVSQIARKKKLTSTPRIVLGTSEPRP